MLSSISKLIVGSSLLYQFGQAGLIARRDGDNGPPITFEDIDNGFNVTNSGGDYRVSTSYLFNKCSGDQQKVLKQAVTDATYIAYAAFTTVGLPGGGAADMIDFDGQAAIDYFGPKSKNKQQQDKIYTTLTRASYATRGWGLEDWWNNRYVQLNCDTSLVEACATGRVLAATSNFDKNFGYPLITFCDIYYTVLPTFATAIKTVTDNSDLRQNSINMRNQGSTMLHEWLHMNWGTAEVCPGGAKDTLLTVGPPNAIYQLKAYRPALTKLLARISPDTAAMNNDNYVYYCLSRYMLKHFGSYPQYPSAWDPNKSREENEDDKRKEPGFPSASSRTSSGDDIDDDDASDSGPAVSGNPLPKDAYPDWYQPLIGTNDSTSLPTINPPPAMTTLPADHPNLIIDNSGPPPGGRGPASATGVSQASPTPSAPATDSCDVSYKFVLDTFDIHGKNFDAGKFGTDGAGLKQQIKGCGKITKWHFDWTPNDPTYQWHATGELPIGTRACVGRAVVSAGGADAGKCKGAG